MLLVISSLLLLLSGSACGQAYRVRKDDPVPTQLIKRVRVRAVQPSQTTPTSIPFATATAASNPVTTSIPSVVSTSAPPAELPNNAALYIAAVDAMLARVKDEKPVLSPGQDVPLPSDMQYRGDLLTFLTAMQATHGAEVGVLWGHHSEAILNSVRSLQRLWMIDVW